MEKTNKEGEGGRGGRPWGSPHIWISGSRVLCSGFQSIQNSLHSLDRLDRSSGEWARVPYGVLLSLLLILLPLRHGTACYQSAAWRSSSSPPSSSPPSDLVPLYYQATLLSCQATITSPNLCGKNRFPLPFLKGYPRTGLSLVVASPLHHHRRSTP